MTLNLDRSRSTPRYSNPMLGSGSPDSAHHRSTALSRILVLGALVALSGCSTVNELLQGERLDYKTNVKTNVNRLEIPPGLDTLPRDDRFALPERSPGSTTLSGFNQQRGNTPSTAPMLATVPDARIERAGSQRWLVVNKSPEELWPLVKDFWQDMGFLINIEAQDIGVLETEWAENRAKIPQDFIRAAIGRLIDNVYSTAERDKFRTRLERLPNGSAEIYISHRGMIEVYSARDEDQTVWQPRPSDPELEAEFLRRLLIRFGVESARAGAIMSAAAQPSRAVIAKLPAGASVVVVEESFDRAWRRVGLALDRVGFTVVDRDRSQGIFFVRYVDPEAEKRAPQRGFLGRLFSFGSSSDARDASLQAVQYRIVVKEGANNATQVMVQTRDGGPESSSVGTRILNLLQEQLK